MSKLRFIPEGAKGFARNGVRSAASIVILCSSLLLIGIFTTLMLVINRSVERISDFNEIVVFMNLDADKQTVADTGEAIRKIKNVTKVTYIAKADALESEKSKFGEEYAYIFESYDDDTNPLPDTFRIEYTSVDDIDAIIYNIGSLDGIDKIKNRYDIAKNIRIFKNALSFIGTWLMVLLVAVSVFVIANTIKLTYHARELEISVMRYIGATKLYITMPFLFEGAIVGLLSGLIGYLIQYYLYAVPITQLAGKFSSFLSVPSFGEMNLYYLPIYFAAGLVFGVFGSALATRKYMKV